MIENDFTGPNINALLKCATLTTEMGSRKYKYSSLEDRSHFHLKSMERLLGKKHPQP